MIQKHLEMLISVSMFAEVKFYLQKMTGFFYINALNNKKMQQPCCVVKGFMSSMRTMCMFMQ